MNAQPFYVKDCALATISNGLKAQTLGELRDRLEQIPTSSIYFHFWGGRLRTSYEFREYHNDFSHWAHHSIHDNTLAERLELLAPTDYTQLDDLSKEIIEIIENRLDEKESLLWSEASEPFYFLRSKVVIFSTHFQLNTPSDLAIVMPKLTRSSLFYHFIDAGRRTPDNKDDFTTWLQSYGESTANLVAELKRIDPYFISLSDLQTKLTTLLTNYFK